MIDFKLNNSGDIILENKKNFNKFTLTFIKSEFPTFKTNFQIMLDKKNILKDKEKYFKLSFNTDFNKDKKIKFKTIQEEDELKQRIMIKLRTELGEIYHNQNFGSSINIYRHDIINDTTLSLLSSLALDTIKNITNDEYKVTAKQVKRKNSFSTENINLYIFKNNELFLTFEL